MTKEVIIKPDFKFPNVPYATDVMLKTLFDPQSILAAVNDNSPAALPMPEQTLLGRITGGNIAALTPAQVNTLLGTFPSNAQISLGSLHLPVYTPQSVTGVTHTPLKMIDNSTDLEFRIGNIPTAPSGWTAKGMLRALIKSSTSSPAMLELYNVTDSAQVESLWWNETHYYLSDCDDPFTLPASSKSLQVRIWHASGLTCYCAGAWIDFVAVKD